MNPFISKDIIEFLKNEPRTHLYNINNSDYFNNAPFYNDTLMYYDENHINFYGSQKLAIYEGEKISNFLKELLK